MTFFDWLLTSTGVEFTHAVIALLIAASGWLSYQNHRRIISVDTKLDAHVARVEEKDKS